MQVIGSRGWRARTAVLTLFLACGCTPAPLPPVADSISKAPGTTAASDAGSAADSSEGFHDPTLPGTGLLQSPAEAFAGLPTASAGNHVNWTEALRTGKIHPRFDKNGSDGQPQIFDLDIVREVKGYTPPAVFPHAAHSEWIDCPVCHPGLFIPKKGANSMSMAEIMLGQKCGVCHGTVAFPASECRRCHYRPKPLQQADKKPSGVVRAAQGRARPH